MSDKSPFSDRLPKGVVAALVGLAIVTAFFVGKSVSGDSTPVPQAAASVPLDAIDGATVADGYSDAGQVAAADRAPRRETVAVNAAAVPGASRPEGATADPGAGEADASSAASPAEEPEIVSLAPPPPETEGAEAF